MSAFKSYQKQSKQDLEGLTTESSTMFEEIQKLMDKISTLNQSIDVNSKKLMDALPLRISLKGECQKLYLEISTLSSLVEKKKSYNDHSPS